MPSLTRNTGGLLRTVSGKPHARPEDHLEPFPTPPPTNETRDADSPITIQDGDIYGSPESSGDEDANALPQFESAEIADKGPKSKFRPLAGEASFPQTDGGTDNPPRTFRMPSVMASSSQEGKCNEESEDLSSDGDQVVFSSQGSTAWKKTRLDGSVKSGSRIPNHHALPRKQTTYGNRRRLASPKTKASNYLRTPVRSSNSTKPQNEVPKFKHLDAPGAFNFTGNDDTKPEQRFRAAGIGAQSDTQPRATEPEGPATRSRLRLPSGMPRYDTIVRDPLQHGGRADTDATLGHIDPDGFHTLDNSSPSLSSLSPPPSSPEVEEIKELDLPPPKPYVPITVCTICGEEVELYLKQDFEDKFARGKRLNFRLQQRFCRSHKVHYSLKAWRDLGYPDIDWDNIGRRLRRHNDHIEAVLDQKLTSFYRQKLEETVSSRAKTAMQAISGEEKSATSVGYYGSRGEKVMADHILSAFSGKLRDLAVSDKLIAAVGVSGGVSGYLQAVLVPELAVSLVCEDMEVGADRARGIMGESAELGDLLNAEQDERVQRNTEDD